MNSTTSDLLVHHRTLSNLASFGLGLVALAALNLGGRAWLKRIVAPLDGFGLPSGS